MEIQVFRNKNSSQTNAYSHYSNYAYSGLIPNERALSIVNVVVRGQAKSEKISLPVTVRVSKTRVLKLPIL